MWLDEIMAMVENFREKYRLGEDAALVIAPPRDLLERLEVEDRLLGGDDGEMRYVMVGETKVRVDEGGLREKKASGTSRETRRGRGQVGRVVVAGHTGPRHTAFTKRGKR